MWRRFGMLNRILLRSETNKITQSENETHNFYYIHKIVPPYCNC